MTILLFHKNWQSNSLDRVVNSVKIGFVTSYFIRIDFLKTSFFKFLRNLFLDRKAIHFKEFFEAFLILKMLDLILFRNMLWFENEFLLRLRFLLSIFIFLSRFYFHLKYVVNIVNVLPSEALKLFNIEQFCILFLYMLE